MFCLLDDGKSRVKIERDQVPISSAMEASRRIRFNSSKHLHTVLVGWG